MGSLGRIAVLYLEVICNLDNINIAKGAACSKSVIPLCISLCLSCRASRNFPLGQIHKRVPVSLHRNKRVAVLLNTELNEICEFKISLFRIP